MMKHRDRVAAIAASACGLLLAVAWAAGGVAQAQLRGVTATVTPLVGSDGVHAGTEVRAGVQVALPEGFHVQSDRPRDPSLIPTRLTVEPVTGVTVAEIVYPSPTDLKQVGTDAPLAVFAREFAIGLRLLVARDASPSDITMRGRLRYQACNDTMCFAPTTADTQWTLHVVPTGAPIIVRYGDVLASLPFGRGQGPDATTPSASARAARSRPTDEGVAQLDGFTALAASP